MASLKDILRGIMSFAAALCWLGAIGVLAWQSWGWLSTGMWSTIPISAPVTYLFGPQVYLGTSTALAVFYALTTQSLALGLVLLGLAFNGVAKIFD